MPLLLSYSFTPPGKTAHDPAPAGAAKTPGRVTRPRADGRGGTVVRSPGFGARAPVAVRAGSAADRFRRTPPRAGRPLRPGSRQDPPAATPNRVARTDSLSDPFPMRLYSNDIEFQIQGKNRNYSIDR